MKHSLPRLFYFALSLISAAIIAEPNPSMPTGQPSPVASAYFEQAFTFIKDNAYFHKHLDFAKIKQQALTKMVHAQSPADTHEAIRFVL
ncbi:hypothetical protein [Dyadobacter fermentans]|uniref:hypothetical protein n=1 Tax=Dyadobacter fermentans TaxID=94254 RepID=UPI001180BDC9|nr:hypothetical protein [Dyadobacter fermentans]